MRISGILVCISGLSFTPIECTARHPAMYIENIENLFGRAVDTLHLSVSADDRLLIPFTIAYPAESQTGVEPAESDWSWISGGRDNLAFRVYISAVLSDQSEALNIFSGYDANGGDSVARDVYEHLTRDAVLRCAVGDCAQLIGVVRLSALATAMFLKFSMAPFIFNDDYSLSGALIGRPMTHAEAMWLHSTPLSLLTFIIANKPGGFKDTAETILDTLTFMPKRSSV